jgi:imidazolonepropionase-like amidohydrolase
MKKRLGATKPLLLLLFLSVASGAQERSPAVVLRDVTVIDMKGGRPKPNMTVVVRGNRISEVGRRVTVPKNAEVVDAAGKFLIPGLWDSYTLTLEAVKEGFPYFEMMVAHGVTCVRDTGTTMDLREAARLRGEIDAGRTLGPRLFYAGRTVNGTNLPSRGTNFPLAVRVSLQARDADEAARFVETQARAGVDYVKVGTYLPPELLPAVVAAAARHKLPVLGYVVSGYAEASDAGVNCIEHFADLYRSTSTKREEYFAFYRERRGGTMTEDEAYRFFDTLRETRDRKYYSDTLRRLARNGTCVVTNVAEQGHSKEVFEVADASRRRFKTAAEVARLEAFVKRKEQQYRDNDPRTRESDWQANLQDIGDLHRAGVMLLAGTQSNHEDLTSPGIWLHDELYWLVRAGLSPFEALKAATVNPAKFMRREKDLGTVERGKLADLVLLDANPLADIGNTRKINAVVMNGRLLRRKDLDAILDGVARRARK